jgi:tetratricopeptide (TPR) repeat protein
VRPQEVTLLQALGQVRARLGRWQQAVECYAAARALRRQLGVVLAEALVKAGRVGEGVALLERLIAQSLDNPWLRFVHGHTLYHQGRYKEAEEAYRQVIRLQPDHATAHNNLGDALNRQKLHNEAEAAYRQAIRLKPDFHEAYSNLGNALNALERHKDAETACRQAIRLKHDCSSAHNNLGIALNRQGKHKEAEAAFRQAIRLEPDDPVAQTNLGGALTRQGRYVEAEAALRQVIRIRPNDPEAHDNLGLVLFHQRRYQEAETSHRHAIGLKPDYAKGYFNLGNALHLQGRYKEEEAAFRQAIRLQPDDPEAHCNLGHVLRDQGQFREALVSLRRGHAMGSGLPGWRYPSSGWVRRCQRLVELDSKLTGFLAGDAEPPSARERLELADLCQLPCKRLHATAARLAADAIPIEPQLADDLEHLHRYNAACSAALAAAGQAEDARLVPDKLALKLRQQAWRWLRADLDLYAKLAQRSDRNLQKAVQQRLAHWQQDPDLASLRDPKALARLDADERHEWRQLWQQVDALLNKVAPKK